MVRSSDREAVMGRLSCIIFIMALAAADNVCIAAAIDLGAAVGSSG
jgi:hypothetical protein